MILVFIINIFFQAKLIKTVESKQLVLALEPEVASIYCTKVPVNLLPDQSKESMEFDVDTEYVIIDAGGRSYEKLKNRNRKCVIV